MNVKSISRTVGLILLITGIFQLFPLLIAVIDHEPRNILAYIESLCLILLVGSALLLFSRGGNRMFSAQEGFAATGLSWIFMSAFGALPFFLSGQIPSYVDAFFEMVSGFTTTGASILTDVEALSRCNLFWRSFSHWLGGMGVLVFLLAVVPGARKNGGTGIYLMRAESPGPSVDKLTPHLRQTAMILYGIYILLTALCIVCLLLGGMPVFDSFCIAFGTAGTGGFAIKNSSMGGYSCFLQTVVTVFMFLFGVNFSLYYMLLLRKFKAVFKNEELRLYFGIAASSIILIAINISRMYNTIYESVHHAAFQVVSIMTTTGYGTVDFEQWPAFSKAILLSLMFIGASAGSTGGGLKVSRVLLLMKSIRRTIRKALHPRRCFIFQKNADLFSIFTFRFLIKPFYFDHRFLCVIKKLYFFTCFFISGTVFYMQTDTAFPIFCDRIFYINFIFFPLIFLFLPIHKKCHYLHWFQTFNAKSWLQIFC